MTNHRRIQTFAVAVMAAVAFAVSTVPVLDAARVPGACPVRRAPFAWPGVFDLVGTGFPDGERKAVIHIARADTSYSLLSLEGPPGSLVRFRVTGDSAHVVWNLGGGELMVVDLRGVGDSLTGVWASGDWTGPLRGVRRP